MVAKWRHQNEMIVDSFKPFFERFLRKMHFRKVASLAARHNIILRVVTSGINSVKSIVVKPALIVPFLLTVFTDVVTAVGRAYAAIEAWFLTKFHELIKRASVRVVGLPYMSGCIEPCIRTTFSWRHFFHVYHGVLKPEASAGIGASRSKEPLTFDNLFATIAFAAIKCLALAGVGLGRVFILDHQQSSVSLSTKVFSWSSCHTKISDYAYTKEAEFWLKSGGAAIK